jgi:acetyl-CoA synthetase
MSEPSITSLSKESRVFAADASFSSRAHVGSRAQYDDLYRRSIDEPHKFWLEQAAALSWARAPTCALTGSLPHARWFEDGKLNVAYNCLDRHVESPRRHKAAIVWEGENGEQRVLTYDRLCDETTRFANVLKSLGVRAGDRVAIYMGMVPEAAVAMLACARIGAVHSVIFGGFAAEAIRDRVNDAQAKIIVTQDGSYRRGQVVPLKETVDHAVVHCPTVEHVVVLRRTNQPSGKQQERDVDWHEATNAAARECLAEPFDAEHPLFILYTSGSTGRPKGVLHTSAGYLLQSALTTRLVFDLRDDDLYWCTADIGWVTGHSYSVYGPLANGATIFMYEGAPNFPDWNRFWSMIERHRINILYTAPTAIRAFVRAGDAHVTRHDLSSLRVLGSVGEPINPEAWMWYRTVVGQERCPVVDTWWQTETGGIMVTPLPGAIPQKPGSCAVPFFGVSTKILREDGSEAAPNEGGLLVIDKPWPGMLRTIWGDDDRFIEQYFTKFKGKYLTGDGARRDEDGYFWMMGRVDDVVNVSGHRLGTAEIESALVSHPQVAEAAVVSRPDDLKGQALVAFVTVKGHVTVSDALKHELAEHVAGEIGRFARPDALRFAEALPKTRSGKIMRRLLKEIAAGKSPTGDTTTLEDFSVLAKLRSEED